MDCPAYVGAGHGSRSSTASASAERPVNPLRMSVTQQQTVEAYLEAYSDPNFIFLGYLATEMIGTLIVTAGLAVVVKRSQHLVESRSNAERTRASLARYFSPNVVDHLSGSKDLLGSVREQEVAVLFADIMGFSKIV